MLFEWQDEFEAASLNPAYTVFGTPTLDTGAIRGGQSLRVNANTEYLQRTINNDNTVRVFRFYFRLNQAYSATAAQIIFGEYVNTGGGGTHFQIRISTSGFLQAFIASASVSVTSTVKPNAGDVHLIEGRCTINNGGTQTLEWMIDGAAQTTLTWAGPSTASSYSTERTGNVTGSGATLVDFDIDSVASSNVGADYPIGPPTRGVAFGADLVPAPGDGVFVEVSWTDGPGIFTIGTSTLDGPDVLGGSFPIENWTDITGDVQACTISRGRQDATSPIQQSTCTVTVVDTVGKYNAANSASPLYGLIAPSRPMRVFVRYQNVDYTLWTGVTQEVVAAPSAHDPYATISGVDLLERLAQEEPEIPVVAETTTGAAIGMVLDAIGWWGDRRSLTTGDAIINFGTGTAVDPTQVIFVNGIEMLQQSTIKALDLINQILDHEGGIFFMDVNGDAVYMPYQGTQLVSATVAATNLITPGVSIDTIYNRAVVTASQGAPQEFIDGASAGRHGPRDVPNTPLTASWLPDEEAAAVLAQRLTQISQTQPIWGLTLQKSDLSNAGNQALYEDMLSLDLGDRITLSDTGSSSTGDYSIEGISHTIQSGGLDHSTTWVLRMRPVNVFTIGQSVLDGPDTLGA